MRPGDQLGRGTASVEFVIMVPFIVALLAMTWDVREQLSFRTNIAQQIHVAATWAADHPEIPEPENPAPDVDATPLEPAARQLMSALRRRGLSGSVAAAVVVRGTVRADGGPCPVEGWCPPRVTVAWPTDPADGRWTSDEGDACMETGPIPWPAEGEHFRVEQVLLPYEARAGDESEWISRNLGATDWWVVVDVCFETPGGTFSGQLANLPIRLLEGSPVVRRRIAWGSIHELADCTWCGIEEAPF